MLSPILLQRLSKFLQSSQPALARDFQGMFSVGVIDAPEAGTNSFSWPNQIDKIVGDAAAQLAAAANGEGWNIDGVSSDEEAVHLWSIQSLLLEATSARNLFHRSLNKFQSSLAGEGGFTPFEMTEVRQEAMNIFDRLLSSTLARWILNLKESDQEEQKEEGAKPPLPKEPEPVKDETHSLGGAFLPAAVHIKPPTEMTSATLEDLRNGINSVSSLIGKLRAATPAGRDEPVVQALKRLQRMTTLLESLGVSSPQRATPVPNLPVRVAPLAVRSFADALAEAFRPLAEQKGLRFAIHCDPNLSTVETDAPKLHRAISLIIGNAIQYTAQGGVSIGTRAAGPDWTLTVEDTGPGIEPTKLAQLLSGQVLGPDRIPHGIAVARELVNMLGGHLDVDSVLKRGSRFAVCLPKTRSMPASSVPVAARRTA